VAAFTLLAFLPVTSPAAGQREERGRTPAAAAPVLGAAELTGYRALRRMHAVNEKFDQEAWLEAWTELDGSGFRFEVISERGSEYVLNKILRKLLERERELIAAGEAHRAALSLENYDFFVESPAPADGPRTVFLKPRRKDILLVDGRMVLDESGTELLRVEGRLAKNPSFWTSLVNVTREFATLDGVRVPVSTESIAKLKFAGVSRMMVRYEYETINGRPVNSLAKRFVHSGAGSR
jgi:hypothetical protein